MTFTIERDLVDNDKLYQEVTYNISETVQESDVVAMKD